MKAIFCLPRQQPDAVLSAVRRRAMPGRALAAALVLAAAGAYGAETARLDVVAVLRAASCTLALSRDTLDFGLIPAGRLSSKGFTAIGERSTALSIVCEAPARVYISLRDGRAGSAADGAQAALGGGAASTLFGLGGSGGKKIGAYTVHLDAVRGSADDGAVQLLESHEEGAAWSLSDGYAAADSSRRYAWARPGAAEPGTFSVIQQELRIAAVLNRIPDLPALDEKIILDGMTTITLFYL